MMYFLVQEIIDPCLQGRIGAFTENNLVSIPINSRQKRLRANIIAEDIISNICQARLRKQAMRAADKKLKIKNKNSKNTKI